MSVSLGPLEALSEGPPSTKGYTGPLPPVHMQGKFRDLAWIASKDHDGQVEVSLSRSDGKKPSNADARAFFSMWGVRPESEIPRPTRIRFWIVCFGQEQ